MKPFNLEKALAGNPLIDLHNNEKCWLYKSHNNKLIIEYEEDLIDYPQLEYINENVDLTKCYAMWEEPRPTVTLTLPCSLKEPQDKMWFISDWFEVKKSSYSKGFVMTHRDREVFQAGRYFATKEDAQAWLDAMYNSRR